MEFILAYVLLAGAGLTARTSAILRISRVIIATSAPAADNFRHELSDR